MDKVYFDEAGNTGQNLKDDSQPIYCLATNNFSDEEAETLCSLIESNAEELHFKNIKKRDKGRSQILEILNHDLITESKVKYYISHKRFCITGHIIDLLVEPIYYKAGQDLYKLGYNLIFLNALHYEGMMQNELFLEIQDDFVALVRKDVITKEEVKNFIDKLEMFNVNVKNINVKKYILSPILNTNIEYVKFLLEDLEKYQIDLALSTFVVLVNDWGIEFKSGFDVFHDDSKQIQHYQEFIDFISKEVDEVEAGFSTRKLQFPLAINQLELIDSKKSKQVQISDLIASSLAYCIKKLYVDKEIDVFATDILNSKIGNIFHRSLFWQPNYTPESINMINDNGINIIDFLVEQSKKK